MGLLTRQAAIVGIHEFPLRDIPHYSNIRVEAECAKAALDDAGLTIGDVDGYFGCTAPVPQLSALTMCDYLGIRPKIVDDTNIGGSSFLYHLLTAAAYINAGMMEVGLITYAVLAKSRGLAIGTGWSPSAGLGRTIPRRALWWTDAFQTPFGWNAVANFAQIAQRHMYEYGTTSEQLAEIAVTTRYHASMNPEAKYREPITVEDVLNSRMIASPLHMLDCCMISDGGAP